MTHIMEFSLGHYILAHLLWRPNYPTHSSRVPHGFEMIDGISTMFHALSHVFGVSYWFSGMFHPLWIFS
jgi:hypothetical protein